MIQYSVLMEAFISDYWKNTKGIFDFLWTNDDPKVLINKAKKLGFKPDYKSKSSYYLISPDKLKLIRISDHWSSTNIPGLKTCKNIGSCYWTLIHNKKINVQKYQAGIAFIGKLTKI